MTYHRTGTHREHAISILEKDPDFPLRLMAHCTTNGELCMYQYPSDIREEEEGMALQSALLTQKFERTRSKVTEALQAIPGMLFKEFNLPRTNGLDIGCGATGFMKHTLLSKEIKAHGWTEIDANPQAVRANQLLHPQANILQGSYQHLDRLNLEGKLDMITGLSTLDATAFQDEAMRQIGRALKPGGWFLHIQDVRPGMSPCLQALEARNLDRPFPMVADRQSEDVLSFEVNGRQVSVVELFRERIRRAVLRTLSLTPVLNHWVRSSKGIPHGSTDCRHPDASRTYYMNMLLEHTYHPHPVEEAFAVVTLAQKR